MKSLNTLYDKALREGDFDYANRIKRDMDKMDDYAITYGKLQRGELVPDGFGGMMKVEFA